MHDLVSFIYVGLAVLLVGVTFLVRAAQARLQTLNANRRQRAKTRAILDHIVSHVSHTPSSRHLW